MLNSKVNFSWRLTDQFLLISLESSDKRFFIDMLVKAYVTVTNGTLTYIFWFLQLFLSLWTARCLQAVPEPSIDAFNLLILSNFSVLLTHGKLRKDTLKSRKLEQWKSVFRYKFCKWPQLWGQKLLLLAWLKPSISWGPAVKTPQLISLSVFAFAVLQATVSYFFNLSISKITFNRSVFRCKNWKNCPRPWPKMYG